MKNTIKKMIGGIIAVIAFIVPTVSFAASFNTVAGDTTLTVVNYTVNSACTTCWTTTATANAGEIVSLGIYYHNVGPDIATNVRVRLTPQTTIAGTIHTFTATVSADNAPAVTGTVSVTTTSVQTLSLVPNAVIWRANATSVGSSPIPGLPTDVFNANTGLNLGSIAPGWPTQGTVVVRFQVSGVLGIGTTGAPLVTTNSASITSQTTATLNGLVTPNGSSANAWFEWGPTTGYGYVTSSINYGTIATNFSSPVSNLTPNTIYYYRAVAQNALGGIVYGTQMTFNTGGSGIMLPVVTTNGASILSQTSVALNGFITPNGANTNAWFEYGTTPNYGYQTPLVNYGTITTSFSNTLFNLNPNTTYYFHAVAQNAQGTVYGSMLSFTTSGQIGQTNNFVSAPTGSTPTATTLLATEIYGDTAKLNGLVFSSSNSSSNAWFEWGTNSSVGNKTQTVNVGSLPTVKHSDVITGLVQGNTYYYRIVSENMYGKSYGSTMNFVAESNVVAQDTNVVISSPSQIVVERNITTKPTVNIVNRGSATQSLVSLSIDGGTEAIAGGEKRSYHVVWKNDSTQSLKNVVLRVTFPQTIKFESTTNGMFSTADNAVIVDIKTLAPNEGGDAFIVASAGRGLNSGELLVVTANMVYTNASGVQSDAIAYVTHRVSGNTNGLSASVFGSGSFIPTTLFEWVLLIALILILVLLGNHLYGRFSEPAH